MSLLSYHISSWWVIKISIANNNSSNQGRIKDTTEVNFHTFLKCIKWSNLSRNVGGRGRNTPDKTCWRTEHIKFPCSSLAHSPTKPNSLLVHVIRADNSATTSLANFETQVFRNCQSRFESLCSHYRLYRARSTPLSASESIIRSKKSK